LLPVGKPYLNVINDILDFSKIESGVLELEEEDFNLYDSIEHILDIFGMRAAQRAWSYCTRWKGWPVFIRV